MTTEAVDDTLSKALSGEISKEQLSQMAQTQANEQASVLSNLANQTPTIGNVMQWSQPINQVTQQGQPIWQTNQSVQQNPVATTGYMPVQPQIQAPVQPHVHTPINPMQLQVQNANDPVEQTTTAEAWEQSQTSDQGLMAKFREFLLGQEQANSQPSSEQAAVAVTPDPPKVEEKAVNTGEPTIESLQAKIRDMELAALEAAGEERKADQMRLEESDRKLREAQHTILQLTRDSELNVALSTKEFINDQAKAMAFSQLQARLVQDQNGNWVSPTGQTILDYVNNFSNDENNSFMFKSVQSKGSSIVSQMGDVGASVPQNSQSISQALFTPEVMADFRNFTHLSKEELRSLAQAEKH